MLNTERSDNMLGANMGVRINAKNRIPFSRKN